MKQYFIPLYNTYHIYYSAGPRQPEVPMVVTATNVQDSSALIQWTVSSIAYTPETYVVEYGTSQDSLDMTSDPTYLQWRGHYHS